MARGDDGRYAWWPYEDEFPYWQVWRAVDGLCYARYLGTVPSVVVRAEDVAGLREQMRQVEDRETSWP